MTFIEALSDRRIEFLRKCARLFMIYADSVPKLDEECKDLQKTSLISNSKLSNEEEAECIKKEAK